MNKFVPKNQEYEKCKRGRLVDIYPIKNLNAQNQRSAKKRSNLMQWSIIGDLLNLIDIELEYNEKIDDL